MATESKKEEIINNNTVENNDDEMTEDEIINKYKQMRSFREDLQLQIGKVEGELSEHLLVISALSKLDGKRRAWRMINKVLVERNVEEVLPAVEENRDGLEKVLSQMKKDFETKSQEITNFVIKHKISIQPQNSQMPAASAPLDESNEKSEKSQTGVLI